MTLWLRWVYFLSLFYRKFSINVALWPLTIELCHSLREKYHRNKSKQSNCQERRRKPVIFTSYCTFSCQNKWSRTIPLFWVVIEFHIDSVISRRQILVDDSPEFLKVRQTRSSHPDNKMLIFRVDPLSECAVGPFFVLFTLVPRPWYASLCDGNVHTILSKSEGIIEKGVGWEWRQKYRCIHMDWQQHRDWAEIRSNSEFCSCLDW